MTASMHNKKKNPFKIAAWVVGGILIAVMFALVFGYFVMLLWNWLMPVIFGLPEITYWQAAGIIILARLLFGGLGGGHHDKKGKHKKGKMKFDCGEEFKREFKNEFKNEFKKEFQKDAEEWKHYHEYWKDEGEEAFKEYLKKKKEENE